MCTYVVCIFVVYNVDWQYTVRPRKIKETDGAL